MKRKAVSAVLLVLSLVCIAVGLLRGEGTEVLNKGVNLCLECVGIG